MLLALLLDAYNVLHCSEVLPSQWAEVGAAGLARLIDVSGMHGGRATVVCDGMPPAAERDERLSLAVDLPDPPNSFKVGRVLLQYAGPGRDADSLIERLIDASDSPRKLVVVSNDRRLHRAARRRRCGLLASQHFLRNLAAALAKLGQAPSQPPPPTDPEYWQRKFGLEPDGDTSDIIDETSLLDEADHWMREFGLDDASDDEPRGD